MIDDPPRDRAAPTQRPQAMHTDFEWTFSLRIPSVTPAHEAPAILEAGIAHLEHALAIVSKSKTETSRRAARRLGLHRKFLKEGVRLGALAGFYDSLAHFAEVLATHKDLFEISRRIEIQLLKRQRSMSPARRSSAVRASEFTEPEVDAIILEAYEADPRPAGRDRGDELDSLKIRFWAYGRPRQLVRRRQGMKYQMWNDYSARLVALFVPDLKTPNRAFIHTCSLLDLNLVDSHLLDGRRYRYKCGEDALRKNYTRWMQRRERRRASRK